MESGKIVFAGSIIVDTIKTLDVWPEQGCIANVISSGRAIGGCVPNTGIDLKRLAPEVRVSAFAAVGNDDNGDFAVGRLMQAGIDVSDVGRLDVPTTATDVMTVKTTGVRTFFCQRGAGKVFDPSAAAFDTLDGDIFHLGYLLLLDALDSPDPEFGTRAARLMHLARERGFRTSFDLVSEQSARVPAVVKPVLAQSDYAVINEVEAEAITGVRARADDGTISERRLETLARAVAACGVRRLTVIHCPEGSGALDAAGRFAFLPSLRLPDGWIRGTVGAGDAFCAGMLYGFLRDWNPVDAMHLARASAAANLASDSGTEGALSLDRTLELNERFDNR